MRKRVVIVGGGIAGLAAAHRLLKLAEENSAELDLLLLEGSGRVGGKIKTDRSQGLVIEAGPDSFLTAKPDALALANELGIWERIQPTAREHRDVYVYARGRLRRFPEGLLLMAPSRVLPFLASDIVTWRGKLRMGLEALLPKRAPAGDESLAEFTRRRLGLEALDTIVDPMMAGIYAGDAESMSLRSTFPQFAEMEHKYGSIIRGLRASMKGRPAGNNTMTPFASFKSGLEELVEHLERKLGGRIRKNVPVGAIWRDGGGWRVAAKGEDFPADAVICAAPAAQAADALEGSDPELSALLREIPAVSTATVTIGFRPSEMPKLPRGFGFVVPRKAGRVINAATFISQKFPERSGPYFLVRCFVGGAGKEEVMASSDSQLLEYALKDLKEIAGIKATPEVVRIYRWDKANPQYNVGHIARLKRIEARLAGLPGLWLAGASYYGVGIPDCIRSGDQAARGTFKALGA